MSRKVYMRAPMIAEVPADGNERKDGNKTRNKSRKCCGKRRVKEGGDKDADSLTTCTSCCGRSRKPQRSRLSDTFLGEASEMSDKPQDSNGKQGTDIIDQVHQTQTQRKKCSMCCACCVKRKLSTQSDVSSANTIDIEIGAQKRCCCCRGSERGTKARKKCLNCCKRTLAFFFSHVGLCSLVVGYSIAGGFIFQALEAPFELKERSNVAAIRYHYVELLWNMTEELNILYELNWTVIADDVLIDFQREVYRATKENGWNGQDGLQELQWSYTGALLYSVTVITTIGYGHIAPRTKYGRLVTIFYALVGIPLTLLCLANLGSLLGDCFRFLYKHFIRFLSWICLPAKKAKSRRHKRGSSTREEQNPLRADRSGDGAVQELQQFDRQKSETKDKEAPVRVPLFVSILLIAMYIFGGAMLFSMWENDWNILIGSYFCFITLSTIGFGDFVPGASIDSWANDQKSVLCALYLVFGLSLIAMCFNLMQEEVKAKFRWLALKLNLIDTDGEKSGSKVTRGVL